MRAIATVTKAVAAGDLSKTIDVTAEGEIREVQMVINSMVRASYFRCQNRSKATCVQTNLLESIMLQVMQLRTLADEVSRVSFEVGTLGLLGRVANVPEVEGVWRELTFNVNRESQTASAISRS